MRAILRWFRRRKFASVVGAMPRMLKQLFSARDHYAPAQVERVAQKLQLADELRRFAYAACSVEVEFLKIQPKSTPADYVRLRTELCELFDIPQADFNCKHLRELRNVPNSSWSKSDVGDGTGDWPAGYGDGHL